MEFERLKQIVWETRQRLWDFNLPLSSVAAARLVKVVAAEVAGLELAPVSVTVRVVDPRQGTVTIGDHSFSPGEGEKSRHVIVVNEGAGVLVDPSIDMVRLKDIHIDPLVIADLGAHRAAAGFLKGHRELAFEHQGATLKYKAFPRDTGWRTDEWTRDDAPFLGLTTEILAALEEG